MKTRFKGRYAPGPQPPKIERRLRQIWESEGKSMTYEQWRETRPVEEFGPERVMPFVKARTGR